MSTSLSPSQSAALLDILTHHDTYEEIRDFRHTSSLKCYGPPFNVTPGQPSTSPALQVLFNKFGVTNPGVRDVPPEVWRVRLAELIEHLQEANLSESYDKGTVGIRKTMATAISALMEYPVRGTLGGFARVQPAKQNYDRNNPDDLSRAFRDCLNEVAYSDLFERTVKKYAETDDLEEQEPLFKAFHEHVLLNLASFVHYILVISPKGQYLLKLAENINRLIPYLVVKQTLKIGNVATMLNAMVRVILAKMSVSSFTNWVGLTQSKEKGMNLMQYIISTVLNLDNRDLESKSSKIEKKNAILTKDHLRILREYTVKSAQEQEEIRQQSQNEVISIITIIFRNTSVSQNLTEPQHKQALEYLNLQLSIRDRKEIIRVLCHGDPDHMTQIVRDLVAAYEPIIRRLHECVDLSSTIGDIEQFVKDIIKAAKIETPKGSNEPIIPTVADIANILRKHKFILDRVFHQCCKNGPELVSWYAGWVKDSATQFVDISNTARHGDPDTGAGKFTDSLNELFSSLSPDVQAELRTILDSHAAFLADMHTQSHQRLCKLVHTAGSTTINKVPSTSSIGGSSSSSSSDNVNFVDASSHAPSPKVNFVDASSHAPSPNVTTLSLDQSSSTSTSNTIAGPGAFLYRWQSLIDNSPLTPLTQTSTKGDNNTPEASKLNLAAPSAEMAAGNARIDVSPVVKALSPQFRTVIALRNMDW